MTFRYLRNIGGIGMEKIHVKVDWSEKNYGAVTECEALNGVVAVTAKTYDGLMADLAESVRFHVESCLKDGDTLPEWLEKGDYEFDIELGTSALLRRCEQFTSLAAISRASGISQQQLSHYANGLREPRMEQRRRIVEGIHRIGRKCLELA